MHVTVLHAFNVPVLVHRARLAGVVDSRGRGVRPDRSPPHPDHHLRRQSRKVLLLQLIRITSSPQQERLQEYRSRKVS